MAFDDTKVDVTDDVLAADWNAMVTDQKTRGVPVQENKLGSDCSGSDAAKNRVLTLANSSLSKSVELVIRGGTIMMDGDYTANHLSSSSTITFLTEVWDSDKIKVIYFT